MAIYAAIGGTTNLSQLIVGIDACDQAVMSFQYGTTTPTIHPTGSMWIKSNYAFATGSPGDGLEYYNGSSYVLLADLRGGAVMLNNLGTVPMAAALAMGGYKITGLGLCTATGEAASKDYVDSVAGGAVQDDGSVPMAADLSMGSHKITNLAAPAAGGDAANKTYVDGVAPSWGSGTTPTSGFNYVTLGYEPARVLVFEGDRVVVFDGATNTDQTQTLNGHSYTLQRLDGSAAAPRNIVGYRVSSTTPSIAYRYRAER